jgi:hypothetical protein
LGTALFGTLKITSLSISVVVNEETTPLANKPHLIFILGNERKLHTLGIVKDKDDDVKLPLNPIM